MAKIGCKNFKPSIKEMGGFVIVFNNSANIETDGYFGISHLIEHCMCENIKKYELDFEKYGIGYNASTDFDEVKFHISGLAEGVDKFKELFYNEIVNYKITKDVFERERQIVIQEFNDILSRPRQVFILNILRKYIQVNVPIGEFNDLENLTYEKFIDYKEKYFSVPTFVFNTTPNKIKRNQFKTEPVKLKFIDNSGAPINEPNNKNLLIGSKADTSSTIGYISKFTYDMKSFEEYLYYTLIGNYLTYGLSAPLYKDLREDTGHVYEISASPVIHYESSNNAFFAITLQTNPQFETEIKEKLLKSLKIHLLNPDKNIFDNVSVGYKNSIKRSRIMTIMKSAGFYDRLFKKIDKIEFNFEKFKNYAKKFIESDYILISSKELESKYGNN